jgi:hypothetical protein
MGITVGNTSSSGNPGTADTQYSWNHTCQSNTNLLVIAARARETTDADRPISGVTYNGLTCTKAYAYQDDTLDMGAEIWYRANPPTGTSYAIQVTHTGKVVDPSAGAIDLKGVDTADIVDSTGFYAITAGGTEDLVVNPAATGSMLVAAEVSEQDDVTEMSVTVGTQIDEVDMGTFGGQSGYVLESGGSATVRFFHGAIGSWDMVGAGATFNAGTSGLSKSVSDSININESLAGLLPKLYKSMLTSVTIVESLLPSCSLGNVNISDSITLADSLVGKGVLRLDVSDSISINEAIESLGQLVRSISDSVTIGESLVGLLPKLFISVNDTISIAEFIQSLGILYGSVSDSISLTEFIDKTITSGGLSRLVSDSITINESISTLGLLYSSISDTVSVSEFVNSLGILGIINVDSISIAEAIFSSFATNVSVSDSVTINEAITTKGILYSSISDGISIVENLTGLIGSLYTNVLDGVSVVDSVETLGNLYADLQDTLTLAETINTALPVTVSVLDSVSVADTTAQKLLITVIVNDSIVVAELVTGDGIATFLTVNVLDTISIAESLAGLLPKLYSSVFDTVTATSIIQTLLPKLVASIGDSISISELFSGNFGDLTIDVSDSISIAEVLGLKNLLDINLSDAVIVAEVIGKGLYFIVGQTAIFESEIHTSVLCDSKID